MRLPIMCVFSDLSFTHNPYPKHLNCRTVHFPNSLNQIPPFSNSTFAAHRLPSQRKLPVYSPVRPSLTPPSNHQPHRKTPDPSLPCRQTRHSALPDYGRRRRLQRSLDAQLCRAGRRVARKRKSAARGAAATERGQFDGVVVFIGAEGQSLMVLEIGVRF